VILVGLSLAKVQGMRKVGPALSTCLALMLCLPIGVILVRYYQAPEEKGPRLSASILDESVQTGDLVVFTGLRGVTTLYYLTRLGYRWSDGVCENPSTGRRFACRMFPRSTERNPGVSLPVPPDKERQVARDDLRAFLESVKGPGAVVWVLFGGSDPTDIFLTEELARLGFHGYRDPRLAALGIIPFRGNVTQGGPPSP
jgi:hypothetical protein